ncbi:Phosphomannomutase 2 [Cichlidogyrus casuarinus]|uniref:Phosphomannomutase n=1 Tax=Cichlidogyrus casuarinus TaxID=1844966 RepID=A0ABD2QFZ1_9PLAT
MSTIKPLLLFDLDGTLTPPRNPIESNMVNFLHEQKNKYSLAIVTGSDYIKVLEQVPKKDLEELFEYVFSENGLVVHKQGKMIKCESIGSRMGEDFTQKLINFILQMFSEIQLPKKRGTFVEYRNGLINVSPIGRSCSQSERDEFFAYDKEHKIRENIVRRLKEEFGQDKLVFSIGGQISIDIYPVGWDKSFCLNHLKTTDFSVLHFFGDKTAPGGNDHEIFTDSRVQGHSVTGPNDTIEQIKTL